MMIVYELMTVIIQENGQTEFGVWLWYWGEGGVSKRLFATNGNSPAESLREGIDLQAPKDEPKSHKYRVDD
jgi:hypothetical protein